MKGDRTKLTLRRVLVYCYLAQGAIGFAVGLVIPWLYYFGVIR